LPAAVLGIEDQAPILDRQPIHADDQNCSDVFPTYSVSELVFGPIPVECPILRPCLVCGALSPASRCPRHAIDRGTSRRQASFRAVTLGKTGGACARWPASRSRAPRACAG
jgi:hypothetical protein